MLVGYISVPSHVEENEDPDDAMQGDLTEADPETHNADRPDATTDIHTRDATVQSTSKNCEAENEELSGPGQVQFFLSR